MAIRTARTTRTTRAQPQSAARIVLAALLAFSFWATSTGAGPSAAPSAAASAVGPASAGAAAAEASLQAAQSQFNAGNYSAAVTTLQAVLMQNPSNAEACYWLGRSYYELRDYDN